MTKDPPPPAQTGPERLRPSPSLPPAHSAQSRPDVRPTLACGSRRSLISRALTAGFEEENLEIPDLQHFPAASTCSANTCRKRQGPGQSALVPLPWEPPRQPRALWGSQLQAAPQLGTSYSPPTPQVPRAPPGHPGSTPAQRLEAPHQHPASRPAAVGSPREHPGDTPNCKGFPPTTSCL